MEKLNIKEIKKILEDRVKDDKFKSLKDMPQPSNFKDIDKATLRIIEALKNDETINIVGDYDADGVISTAIMVEFFNKAIGVEVNYIIPNRFEHGYGISEKILDFIYDGIIITVDNGIGAIEVAKIAKKRGLDLIITDHHTVGDKLPEAYAIINPKQKDCKFPFSDICGANVAWYLCANIKKHLKIEYNLIEFFDLLTIAIIADIMPMKSLNKTIVKRGLKEIEKSNRASIVALKERFGVNSFNEDDIGFKIAPLINSAGRMDDASVALEFLLAYDKFEADEILDYLIDLNENRKQEQLNIFEDAKTQVDANDSVIVVQNKDWNEGIIGIVAAKLSDKYKKPAFVFSKKGDILKGSGRNNSKVSLYDLIESVKEYTLGFGGHKGAAGLSVDFNCFNDFKKAINESYKKFPSELTLVSNNAICELNISLVQKELFDTIDLFRPFGLENELPSFIFTDLIISNIQEIGKNKEYKKLTLTDGVNFIESLVFVDIDKIYLGDKISFVATINKNEFRDEVSYNLLLKEIL